MPEGDPGEDKGFNAVMRDLEDNIFGINGDEDAEETQEAPKKVSAKRKKTLPTLVDQNVAQDILKDVMKEKNQRKYDVMGVELTFKPYWFFTYTCELLMRDQDKNIIDSDEIGGRVAIDAVTGELSDYLQDLLDKEPIDIVDLSDEMGEVGGDAKIAEAKISEKRLEHFITQKISGALRAEKENVSVAGFDLVWAPVYKFWLTVKKKTHHVQIDGTGGYPIDYDNVPLKPKTWADRIRDDIDLLKEPKKWGEFLKKKRAAMKVPRAPGQSRMPKNQTIEIVAILVILLFFLYGMNERDTSIILISCALTAMLIWYMNEQRKKSRRPLPMPPQPPEYRN